MVACGSAVTLGAAWLMLGFSAAYPPAGSTRSTAIAPNTTVRARTVFNAEPPEQEWTKLAVDVFGSESAHAHLHVSQRNKVSTDVGSSWPPRPTPTGLGASRRRDVADRLHHATERGTIG